MDSRIASVIIVFRLAENKIIRSRTVYSILTMVSEISGFADLLMVFTSIILGIVYTPFKLESALLEHMGHVDIQHKQSK